ncbi:MAG TPA: hypothetical protein VJO32_08155 [Ktedonobacteraceae bacterium]|nr:hypothetical protein [Ktedonobacteraceae bacterium]
MNSEQASTDPTVPPIEQAARPEDNHTGEPVLPPAPDDAQGTVVSQEEATVIWTPRFIILFAVTLVAGLSLESLFTQGWAIRLFSGTWIFLGHVVLLSAAWIILLIVSRSRWIRLGAAFGLIFAAFIAINVTIQAILVQPSNYLLAHVNVLICLALAGCYICLTVDRLLAGRWDAWLLGLTPIIGAILLALLYFLKSDRSMSGLENSLSIVALMLSIVIFWMRPTCWRNAPGPTFLFGFVPFLLLAIAIVYVINNSFDFFPVNVTLNASASFASREKVFFFSQVPLLCLLLGVMRLIQSEKIAVALASSPH